MSLHDRASAAFDAALATTRVDPALAAVHASLAAQRDRYRRKMSVALVGRVSSGKSTLANALLGGTYAATGIEELTYNVSWLRHGPHPEITVHFTDGRKPERRDRDDLRSLAVRAHGDPQLQRYLTAIAYVEVTDPNPRLAGYDLVDTPGLDAVSGTAQARKTLAFLGRTADEVRADTVSFAAQADALILVFSRGMAGTDDELVSDFVRSGLGTANPITAVGALTKIELHWPRVDLDPIRRGRLDAERLMAAPSMRRLLFELKPVAGKVAAAAGVFTEEDLEDLKALKEVSEGTLMKRLKFGPDFCEASFPDLPVPASRRNELFNLFGAYGIFLACELIRAGVDTAPELRAQLEQRSGLSDLRSLLTEHFSRRADVIKLRGAIDEAAALPKRFAAELGPRELDRARRAAAEVTGLGQEPAFRELAALRDYLLGELVFTEEEGAELARIAGEHGHSLADRLGRPPDSTLDDLAAAATERHAYWAGAVLDPRYAGANHGACQVMLSAYDQISYEIGRARRASEGR
jgi:Dynamin family